MHNPSIADRILLWAKIEGKVPFTAEDEAEANTLNRDSDFTTVSAAAAWVFWTHQITSDPRSKDDKRFTAWVLLLYDSAWLNPPSRAERRRHSDMLKGIHGQY